MPVRVESNWKSTFDTSPGFSVTTAGALDPPSTTAFHDHAESLFGPEALNLLVIHYPADVGGIVVRPRIPPQAMTVRTVTQSRP